MEHGSLVPNEKGRDVNSWCAGLPVCLLQEEAGGWTLWLLANPCTLSTSEAPS